MKISEILNEGTSLASTARAITNDIGTPISDLFDRIKFSVRRLVDNNGLADDGEINGLGLIVGGETGRWINTYWVGKLENELYDLVKYSPKYTSELKNFLMSDEKKNFSALTRNLPGILKDIAKKLGLKSLYENADTWEKSNESYQHFLRQIKKEAAEYGSSAYDSPEPAEVKEPDPVAKQNVAVEAIINDTLSRIDKKQAGEIRNILARSANKLQTLQAELTKRNIHV
jgi:hypothetical protein